MFSSRAGSSGHDHTASVATPIFMWLPGEKRLQLVDRWQTQLIRNSSGCPVSLPGLGAEPGGDEAAWVEPGRGQHIVFDAALSAPSESTGFVSGHAAVCYDDAAYLLHDWDVFHDPSRSGAQSPSPMQKRLTRLMERVKQRYRLSRGEDLEPLLDEIPKRDMARLASLRGIYLEDFGGRIREPWGGELSNTMNAYLLYLMAVQDRQSGRLDRALKLFQGVAGTGTLMPDLYRSKAHHHLCQMAEERGEPGQALDHYERVGELGVRVHRGKRWYQYE